MIARLLIGCIRLYQRTAPFRPACCRFLPTCSQYAIEAIQAHGAVRGCMLAARRILRCHPWSRGGVDPVPPPLQATPAADRRSHY